MSGDIRRVLTCFALAALVAGCAGASRGELELPRRGPSTSGTFGYDLAYVMTFDEARDREREVPEGEALAEIVRVGARAVLWADVLQRDIAPEKREQLWRRIDKVGKEPTPEKPLEYDPATIREAFAAGIQAAPAGVEEVIRGTAELPPAPPAGAALTDIVAAIRRINLAYSRASRWLALYEWKDYLRQESRDVRPWLRLRAEREILARQAADWARLTRSEREAWVLAVLRACGFGPAPGYCKSGSAELLEPEAGEKALAWLGAVHELGRQHFEALFRVRSPHPGVKVERQGAALSVTFFTLGIPADVLAWIAEQVDVGFRFAEHVEPVALRLEPVEADVPGAVKVQWQPGALPHVNGVGGDTIVMDANTVKWLEQTQVTMTHEFGHVIGFPDCYVEFWDVERESFVFYSLEPEDRMCALSGGTLDRHRVALREAFGG
jgi:hypothetical protein